MITEVQTIYRCEHCKKLYQLSHACLKHEKTCKKNPENARACFFCQFLDYEVATIYDGKGNEQYKRELPYCAKLKSFMYPPIIEHKGKPSDMGEQENQPMRKKCDMRRGMY